MSSSRISSSSSSSSSPHQARRNPTSAATTSASGAPAFATSAVAPASPASTSRRRRFLRYPIVRALLLVAGVAGCNAILDNEKGTLATDTPSDVTPNQPAPGGDGGGSGQVPRNGTQPEGGSTLPPQPERDASTGGISCAPSQRACYGACVGLTDPVYGCGDPNCSPCKTAHGQSACQGTKCVVQACDPGYADCNQDPADGCEVDLSKAVSCGACNAVCPATAPVCAPAGASFQCTTGCTAAAPLLCGTECVSPLTSVNHCGACNQKCPDIDQATSACNNGLCTFTCKPGYHACGQRCAVETDPTACGPTCTACPLPTNGTPICQAGACGLQCNPGFGNCNNNPTDGCETNFSNDPLNCGACGISCNGGTCTNSVCTAPPPQDGG